MIPKLEKFKKQLSDVGLRPTFQRIKIFEHIDKYRYAHPTVEKIYKSLNNELPMISMATVYNAMNTFYKKGILNVLTITGGEFRYDPNLHSHHHFLCLKCGTIYDINISCPINKKKKIGGHIITEVHGYFKGVCNKCSKKHPLFSRSKKLIE